MHAKGKPLGDDVSIDVIARRTPGFTGADLANLLNEAALLAARRGVEQIGMPEVEAAIDRVIAGPERKTRVMSDREKQVIAYHEGGHALVGHVLPNTDPIHKVSIIARGRALGWTLALPTEDKVLRTRSELRDELAMLLGGRTAEELIFGDPTTGAQNDIERATQIARAMVTEFGMSDLLGPQQFGDRDGEPFLGRDMGHEAQLLRRRRRGHRRRDRPADRPGPRGGAGDPGACTGRPSTGWPTPLVERETLEEAELALLFDGLGTWEPADETARAAAGVGPAVGRGARRWPNERRARRRRADGRRVRPPAAPTGPPAVAHGPAEPGWRRPGVRRAPRPGSLIVDRRGGPTTEPAYGPCRGVDRARIEKAVREILEAIGEDPDRDGLRDTPARVARMYDEIFSGLRESPDHHLKVTFEADHDEMIMVRDIPMLSASASTTSSRSWARPTSPTSRTTTAGSPGCRSWPGWSTPTPGGRRCRSG